MRFPRYRAALMRCLVLACVTGCSPGWRSFDPGAAPTPARLPERQVVEFRADSQLVRVHAVRITQDSLSGIPWLEHTSCDSCRISYARARITELKTGSPGQSAWGVVIPFMLLIAPSLIFAITCGHCLDT